MLVRMFMAFFGVLMPASVGMLVAREHLAAAEKTPRLGRLKLVEDFGTGREMIG